MRHEVAIYTLWYRVPPYSQVDNTGVIVEKFAAISRNLLGNTIWIFDVLRTKLLKYVAKTVVPSLPLLGRLAGVRCSELEKQFVTCMKRSSQSAYK